MYACLFFIMVISLIIPCSEAGRRNAAVPRGVLGNKRVTHQGESLVIIYYYRAAGLLAQSTPCCISARRLIHCSRMQNLSLAQIERAIEKSEPEDQRQLLVRLPRLIGIDIDTLALLKLAGPSFEFWNNEQDSIYDRL